MAPPATTAALAFTLLFMAVPRASAQPMARLHVAVQSDGIFAMDGFEPKVLETGRIGVDFLATALNSTGDAAVVEFRAAALDYFASSLGFEVPAGALDVPIDAPVVLGGCGENGAAEGCLPTLMQPYMSVLSLNSFAVARSDMALDKPARLTDGGFQFAAGSGGFKTTGAGELRLPVRGFFGVQTVAFPNETLVIRFRTRELISLDSALYDFEAEADGYGSGSVGGAFKLDIFENGTGRYQDWMVGSFG